MGKLLGVELNVACRSYRGVNMMGIEVQERLAWIAGVKAVASRLRKGNVTIRSVAECQSRVRYGYGWAAQC